jgi:hypothetical protein
LIIHQVDSRHFTGTLDTDDAIKNQY